MSQPETSSAKKLRILLNAEFQKSHPHISTQELDETNLEALIQLSENPRLKALREFQQLETPQSVEGHEKRYAFLWKYLKLSKPAALITEATKYHFEKSIDEQKTQPKLSKEHHQLSNKLLEYANISLKIYD